MSRSKCTLFCPNLGCRYVVINTKTKEKVIGRTLGIMDKDIDSDIRSGKKCVRGEEFFKMFINNAVVKFKNSNLYEKCLSEDGQWEFTEERPSADLPKQNFRPKRDVPIPVAPKATTIHYVNTELYKQLTVASS